MTKKEYKILHKVTIPMEVISKLRFLVSCGFANQLIALELSRELGLTKFVSMLIFKSRIESLYEELSELGVGSYTSSALVRLSTGMLSVYDPPGNKISLVSADVLIASWEINYLTIPLVSKRLYHYLIQEYIRSRNA